MADKVLPDMSDELLIVRMRGRIYVIPSAQMEGFRNQKFEKLKGDRIDQIFDRARDVGDAAMLNVVVVADADIQPPPYAARGARKGAKASATKSRRSTKA